MRRIVFFSFLAAISLALFSCKNRSAHLILINGRIHTMDSAGTIVQALAIRDGKIEAIGSTDMMLTEFRYDSVIDLKGAAVFPGFIDAHCHFMGYARNLGQVDLLGTDSFDVVLARVDSFAKKNPDGWIQGRGWDQNDWRIQQFPDNSELNRRYPDRPVFLQRVDGHAALVNQKALDLAGIHADTYVAGGSIRKKNGVPTGILLDNAVDLVKKVLPRNYDQAYVNAIRNAEQNCFEAGLTTLSDAGLDLKEILLIDSLQKAGLLSIRVYAMANPSEENFRHFQKGPYQSGRLHVCAFKVYADGALGSRGACLLKPYTDDEGNYGFLLHNPDYFLETAIRIRSMGFQMNTHCIGDSANRLLLETYGEVIGKKPDHRWRIEHCQIISPEDMQLFRKYGIVPSVQPTHATSDMYWAKERLGHERMPEGYAYKSLAAQNNWIVFGTDFPVEKISPYLTLYAACARRDLSGFPIEGFQMDEKTTREHAIKAMTIWAAKGNFEEKEKGSLEPGKLADIVVVDKDLLFCDEKDIPAARTLMTLVNGQVVFSRD